MPQGGAPLSTTDLDEILVKGEDGKFYILKGDTLVPAEGHGGDESEVQVSAARAGGVGGTASPSPERVVKDVIQTASLMVPDAVIAGRLEKAIIMFFKDLRDRLETKEALMRSTKVGGVGLSEVQVDTLLRIAEEKRGEWLKVESGGVASPAVSVPPPPKSFTSPAPAKTSPPPTPALRSPAPPPNLPIVAEVQMSKPVPQPVVPSKPIVPPPPIPKPPPPPPLAPKPLPPPPPPLPQKPAVPLPPKPVPAPPLAPKLSIASSQQPEAMQRPVGRPLVTDVLPPQPRAVGPVDELRYELPAFRRLGTPQAATAKVFEKIQLLFRDGWTSGMGSLIAWRTSPVMALVHSASRESILTNTAITDVIANGTAAGKPMVTAEEWKECIALSKKLDLLLEGGVT